VGRSAVVHYVGVGVSSGEEFDASWNRGDTFVFPSGRSRHQGLGPRRRRYEGWRTTPTRDPGALGLRRSGRRRCHRAGETLIFVVDLIELR